MLELVNRQLHLAYLREQNPLTLQFFYGVDWSTIRDIDAPFVPHLRSITDTSYFPTDELDQVPEVPSGAEMGPDAKKDLAFLGYTSVDPSSAAHLDHQCDGCHG